MAPKRHLFNDFAAALGMGSLYGALAVSVSFLWGVRFEDRSVCDSPQKEAVESKGPEAEAATPKGVAQASERYKRDRDYLSLLTVFQYLKAGMARSKVEALLGEPDYSPIDGQYYYFGAGAKCSHGSQAPDAPCGVVIEYRSYPDGTLRNTLQSSFFGAIGE